VTHAWSFGLEHQIVAVGIRVAVSHLAHAERPLRRRGVTAAGIFAEL
jgi:hypothetical protein